MIETVTLVETPRDAFQGLAKLIPTPEKIRYVAEVLDAGFTHVDLGSFVSPKAVPQMADSAEVFAPFAARIGVERIAIVVNEIGAKRAFAIPGVDTLGFPFSISDRFQKENSGRVPFDTWAVMTAIFSEAARRKKGFILYLSMAFGTRYDEPEEKMWSEEKLLAFVHTLVTVGGVSHISLADTVGVAKPKQVARVFRAVRAAFPGRAVQRSFSWQPHELDALHRRGARRRLPALRLRRRRTRRMPLRLRQIDRQHPVGETCRKARSKRILDWSRSRQSAKTVAKIAREFQTRYA